ITLALFTRMYSCSSSRLFLPCSLAPRSLHSFPTRRSSDLRHSRALPHHPAQRPELFRRPAGGGAGRRRHLGAGHVLVRHERQPRSEEHTSELQSRFDLVCRLLLEKKKQTKTKP